MVLPVIRRRMCNVFKFKSGTGVLGHRFAAEEFRCRGLMKSHYVRITALIAVLLVSQLRAEYSDPVSFSGTLHGQRPNRGCVTRRSSLSLSVRAPRSTDRTFRWLPIGSSWIVFSPRRWNRSMLS